MTDTRAPMSRSRRSLRRPIPPLVFLLILALLALGVWWKVLKRDEAQQAVANTPCATATAAQSTAAIDPATVQVRVYNATEMDGLAGQVAAEMGARGFTVAEVGNDSSGRAVAGIGEVRYGRPGEAQAQLVAAQFPGLSPVLDTRDNALVDVAIGPDFTALTPPEQVPAALASAAAAAASSAAAATC